MVKPKKNWKNYMMKFKIFRFKNVNSTNNSAIRIIKKLNNGLSIQVKDNNVILDVCVCAGTREHNHKCVQHQRKRKDHRDYEQTDAM